MIMTVKELIEELKKCPQDKDVNVYDEILGLYVDVEVKDDLGWVQIVGKFKEE